MQVSFPYRLFLLTGIFSLLPVSMLPAAEWGNVLDKARQWLGGDAALQQIETLRYEGVIESVDGKNGTISISLEKPYQQRQTIEQDGRVLIRGLNDLDGWTQSYLKETPDRWNMQIMAYPEVRRFRINTWENLNFFDHGALQNVKIESGDSETIRGRKADSVIFDYGKGVIYQRFFDSITGQLLLTRLDNGQQIREIGVQEIDGIKFPERLETLDEEGNLLHSIEFTRIEVNPEWEGDLFEMPAMKSRP